MCPCVPSSVAMSGTNSIKCAFICFMNTTMLLPASSPYVSHWCCLLVVVHAATIGQFSRLAIIGQLSRLATIGQLSRLATICQLSRLAIAWVQPVWYKTSVMVWFTYTIEIDFKVTCTIWYEHVLVLSHVLYYFFGYICILIFLSISEFTFTSKDVLIDWLIDNFISVWQHT